MRFERESLSEKLIAEVLPLTRLHYQEIAPYKDIPLDVKFKEYSILEKASMLHVYTARTDAGELIGYQSFFISKPFHYAIEMQAHQDTLFIHPEHRGFGMKFLAWCDEQLKQTGVVITKQFVTVKKDFSPMLKRLGYELQEYIYARRLD